MEKTYTVGELKNLIRESSNEFKPKLGPNVESDNKKNNEKSYKESEKKAKDFDGGLDEPKKKEIAPKVDLNRTTLDYNPVVEPSEKYKKRVRAQLKGYTSELEEKNGIEKAGADFDDDEKLVKYFTDNREEYDDRKTEMEKSGLAARTLPNKVFHKNHLAESLKPKRLIFKHTKFLNESQIINRIPEEYKKDGQVIYMKDMNNDEYIVECVKSEYTGVIETNIVGYNNQDKLNEQMNRVQELFNYKTPTENRRSNMTEDKALASMLNTARKK